MKKKSVTKTASKKSSRGVKTPSKKAPAKASKSSKRAAPKKVIKKVTQKAEASKASAKKKNSKAEPVRSARISNALKKLAPVSSVLKTKRTGPLAGEKKKRIELADLPSQAVSIPVEMISDIPFSYNETKIVLMVRDPFWAYTYWDFSGETWNWLVVFREHDCGARPKIRVHNLTQGNFYDLDVYLDAKNWYIELGAPNQEFQLELGLMDSRGVFHRIALSNKMKTPRSGPSEVIDREWELSDFEQSQLYRLSGGGRLGHGSEIFSAFKRP